MEPALPKLVQAVHLFCARVAYPSIETTREQKMKTVGQFRYTRAANDLKKFSRKKLSVSLVAAGQSRDPFHELSAV